MLKFEKFGLEDVRGKRKQEQSWKYIKWKQYILHILTFAMCLWEYNFLNFLIFTII